ncbi:energy-coupling factor transporter transmembrane component T family protein [Martelella radicis]|uniref:Cobalt/nickel transport system permease protein n=1 Tax=Martelella radicis TaxID=1397476 RepID=A0A7W6P821_9HYPH|nr:energy-coupling factor transporter transmembrane component T [Martelella radicis]MBB4120250.1 cobalt/nickel transport system permease protein [Martelella radicis]
MNLPADLRLRMVTVFAVVAMMTPLAHFRPAAAYLALVLCLAFTRGSGIAWRRLLHLEAFLVVLLITLPFAVAGTPLVTVFGFTASAEGVVRALVVALKVTASVLLLNIAFEGVEPVRLGQSLDALRMPKKLVHIFIALVRYLGVIRGEFSRLQEAMKLRAFQPRSNRHTFQTYGNMIGMLLVRATARAERIEEAMRMRGFAGRYPVSEPAPLTVRDVLGAALVAGAALVVLISDLALSRDVSWPL